MLIDFFKNLNLFYLKPQLWGLTIIVLTLSGCGVTFRQAIIDRDIETVKTMLENGKSPNADIKQGYLPVSKPIDHAEDLEILNLLLSYGADPNVGGTLNKRPLIKSICAKDYERTELLLTHGANPDIKSDSNVAALAYSVLYAPPSITELLLKNGADPNIESSREAVSLGNSGAGTMFSLMTSLPAIKGTPLQLATQQRDEHTVKLLLEYNADPSSLNDEQYAWVRSNIPNLPARTSGNTVASVPVQQPDPISPQDVPKPAQSYVDEQPAPMFSQPSIDTTSLSTQVLPKRSGFALVIGIDHYRSNNIATLQNAVADAQAIGQALEKHYGFEVVELFDDQATRSGIYASIINLVKKLDEGENLLIYYAGHGWEDPVIREGYWVPVDGRINDPSTFVNNSELHKFIGAMEKAQHVMIVADSCFSGSFLTRSMDPRSVGRVRTEGVAFDSAPAQRYFSKMDNRKSRLVLTSGSNEPVPDGGRDGHSVFGYYFLRALEYPDEPVFSAAELMQRVQKVVANNSFQTPLVGQLKSAGHEEGQMIFIKNSKQ